LARDLGFAAGVPLWHIRKLRRNPPLQVLRVWYWRHRDPQTEAEARAVRRKLRRIRTPVLRRMYREDQGIPARPWEPVYVTATTTAVAAVDVRQDPPVAYMQPVRRDPERAALPVLLDHLHGLALFDQAAADASG
jgi:hypothetical protein